MRAFDLHRCLAPCVLMAWLPCCHSSSSQGTYAGGPETYSVAGAVTGSSGDVTLACNGAELVVTGNGAFTCAARLPTGASYAVTVEASPQGQACSVTGGSGAIGHANITQVAVTCAQTSFSVIVSVSGLFSDGHVEVGLGNAVQEINENGDLPVMLVGTVGEHVALSIPTQPPGQHCVLNLDGFSFSAVTAHVAIACVRDMQIASSPNAALVLGQTDFVTGTQPAHPAGIGRLDAPVGRVAAGPDGMVFMCEYGGNQVSALLPGADSSHDFRLGAGPSDLAAARYGPRDLTGPTAVATSDTQLAVASDIGSRVLLFNAIPAGAAPADVVVGQAGFGAPPVRTCSPNNFFTPTDVSFAAGRLFVADGGCNRVLIFDPIPTANGAGASLVLGQSDFTSYDPNRGFGHAGPGTLYHPGSVWANANTLFVADAYNNRVLVWSTLPTVSGQAADLVLGQSTFGAVAAGVAPNAFSVPYAIVADEFSLFVADAANNRVVVYALPLPSIVGTAVATSVIGQADLSSNLRNTSTHGVSARGLYQPTGLGFVNATLLVNDGLNYRVVGYTSR